MRYGDWAIGGTQLGKIRAIHPDGSLDVVIYGRNGNKIGRTSPALNGPKTYEPCCDAAGWAAIKTPKFPLEKYTPLNEIVTLK